MQAASLAVSQELLSQRTSGAGVVKALPPQVISLEGVWFGESGTAPEDVPRHEGATVIQLRVDFYGCALSLEEEDKSRRGSATKRALGGGSSQQTGAGMGEERSDELDYDQAGALVVLKYKLHDTLGSHIFILSL